MSCDREVAPPETEGRCFPEAVDAPQQLHEHPAFLILQPGATRYTLDALSHFTANQVRRESDPSPIASSYEFLPTWWQLNLAHIQIPMQRQR